MVFLHQKLHCCGHFEGFFIAMKSLNWPKPSSPFLLTSSGNNKNNYNRRFKEGVLTYFNFWGPLTSNTQISLWNRSKIVGFVIKVVIVEIFTYFFCFSFVLSTPPVNFESFCKVLSTGSVFTTDIGYFFYKNLTPNMCRRITRIWPTYVTGWSWRRADTVCFACQGSGPI